LKRSSRYLRPVLGYHNFATKLAYFFSVLPEQADNDVDKESQEDERRKGNRPRLARTIRPRLIGTNDDVDERD
jgi:hypothetical protein